MILRWPLSELYIGQRQVVVVRADGGALSSNGAFVGPAEVEKRAQVVDRLARCAHAPGEGPVAPFQGAA